MSSVRDAPLGTCVPGSGCDLDVYTHPVETSIKPFGAESYRVPHHTVISTTMRDEVLPVLRAQGMVGKELIVAAAVNIVWLSHASMYDRHFPATSEMDTICMDTHTLFDVLPRLLPDMEAVMIMDCVSSMSLASAHGVHLSFDDSDIDSVLPLVPPAERHDYFQGTVGGKHVMLQHGMRGCGLACVAMLLSDAKGRVVEPEYANLSTTKNLVESLRLGGVDVCVTVIHGLEELEARLARRGSAIVSVTTIGAHYVVVDSVTEDGCQIRDPFHGWAVLLQRGSLETSLSRRGTDVIQITHVEEVSAE